MLDYATYMFKQPLTNRKEGQHGAVGSWSDSYAISSAF